MAEVDGQERTERATPRRRMETRREGRVVLSPDIVTAFVLFACGALLAGAGPATVAGFSESVALAASRIASAPREDLVGAAVLRGALLDAAGLIAPFGLVVFATILAIQIAQVGFVLSGKPMTPKLSRLDPIAGSRRLFSAQGLATFVFSLVKVAAVGFIVWSAIAARLEAAPLLIDEGPEAFGLLLGETARRSIFAAAAAVLVIGAFDFAWRRFRHERSIMMSKQEVEDEIKSTEGDPKIKRRVRTAQRRLLDRRMMRDVKKADVVVTNPHRVAVALLYDRNVSPAPRVLAKGLNLVADRIRREARSAGVPIVENRPLARALYRLVEVGSEIPEKLFVAVAELLAAVYRARTRPARREV